MNIATVTMPTTTVASNLVSTDIYQYGTAHEEEEPITPGEDIPAVGVFADTGSSSYSPFHYNNAQDLDGRATEYAGASILAPDDFYIPLVINGAKGSYIRGYNAGSMSTSLPSGYTYRFETSNQFFTQFSGGCLYGRTTRNTTDRRNLTTVTIIVNDGTTDYEVASWTIYQAVAPAATFLKAALSRTFTIPFSTLTIPFFTKSGTTLDATLPAAPIGMY